MEERNRNNYGFLDLRQIMGGTGRNCFPQPPQPQPQPQLSEPFILGGCCHSTGEVFGHEFGQHNNINNNTGSTSTSSVVVVTPNPSPSPPPPSFSAAAHAHQFGLEMETVNGDGGGGSSSSSSRWPRQETLTLLEIRSRLDSKFKEINLKAPLWDDVSRIMWEEHGYQRSGRKCREKFENLYKYYKKTKEGKAGRHDGKHYRFFRQLQALCEEPINESSDTHLAKYNLVYPNPMTNSFIFNQENQEDLQDQKLLESDNRSNSSEFETSSSINNGDDLSAMALMLKRSMEKRTNTNESQSFRKVKKSWKAKVVEFVDSGMRKLMDTQEVWMEKMLKTIEQKEEESMIREEEWRKENKARLDQEYKFWANERAWIEARDTALMDVLQKFTRKELKVSLPEIQDCKDMEDDTNRSTEWLEPEISSFIQLRTSMEPRFQESENSKEWLWEEIVARMACLGYDWSVMRCRQTWENISFYFNKTMEYEKKGGSVQNSRIYYDGQEIGTQNNDGLSTCSSKIGNEVHENNFPVLMMNEKGTLWDNYDLKFSKE
ncbi:unnamed protein product [Camellia sinensis]|nr:trihelix transcription factor PTL-like [Camellia sinensis]